MATETKLTDPQMTLQNLIMGDFQKDGCKIEADRIYRIDKNEIDE